MDQKDESFDKLYMEVRDKHSKKGFASPQELEFNRLSEENGNMKESLRRLRQLKSNLEVEKRLADAEIVELKIENSELLHRIRALETEVLVEKSKQSMSSHNISNERSDPVNVMPQNVGSVSMTDISHSNRLATVEIQSDIQTEQPQTKKKRGRPPSLKPKVIEAPDIHYSEGFEVVNDKRLSSSTVDMETHLLGSDLLNALSAGDNVSTTSAALSGSHITQHVKSIKEGSVKKRPYRSIQDEQDEEAEFEVDDDVRDKENVQNSGGKFNPHNALAFTRRSGSNRGLVERDVKSSNAVTTSTPFVRIDKAHILATLPSNPSEWTLSNHCDAVASSSDMGVLLQSMRFMLRRFEEGYPNIAQFIEKRIPEALQEIIAIPNKEVLVQISLMVLNNLLARCKTAQFNKIAQLDFTLQLVHLIGSSKHEGVQQHALWVLSNLALSGGQHRKKALNQGAVAAVLNMLSRKTKVPPSKDVVHHAASLIHALSVGGEFLLVDHAPVLPDVVRVVSLLLASKYSRGDVVACVINTLLNMLTTEENSVDDNDNDNGIDSAEHEQLKEIISLLIEDEVITPHLQSILSNSRTDDETYIAVLDIMSFIVDASTEQQVASLLSLNMVENLYPLIADETKSMEVRAAACECLSNVCKTGGVAAIDAVSDADLIPLLVQLASDKRIQDEDLAMYAAYCVTFALKVAELAQTKLWVDEGGLSVLCKVLHRVALSRTDQLNDLTAEILRTLDVLLAKFKFLVDFEHVVSLIDAAGGWVSVAKLQHSKDTKIKSVALVLDIDDMRSTFSVEDMNDKNILMSACIDIIQKKNDESQLNAINHVYQVFEKGGNKNLISTLIIHKIPEVLVSIVIQPRNQTLLEKALLVLNNIIARSDSKQCHAIVQLGFLPRMVELIGSNVPAIQEQAIWILDNVSIEGRYRLHVIDFGAVDQLLQALHPSRCPIKAVEVIGAKALSTFTMGCLFHMPDHANDIAGILSAIERLLYTPHKQTSITSFVCHALVNLICDEESQQELIKEVFNYPNICIRLAQLTGPTCCISDVLEPAVDALTHLGSTPDEAKITYLATLMFLPNLRTHLESSNKALSIKICRCISHLCAGTDCAIQQVFDADLFPSLLKLVRTSKHMHLRIQASYCFLFASHGASLPQVKQLVDMGWMSVLCEQLLLEGSSSSAEHADLVLNAMRSMRIILECFYFYSDYAHVNAIVVQSHGWENVATLRQSKNTEIRKEALDLDEQKIREMYPSVATGSKVVTTTLKTGRYR